MAQWCMHGGSSSEIKGLISHAKKSYYCPALTGPPLSLLLTLTSPCTATFLGLVYANTRSTTKQPPNPCPQPLLCP